MRGLLITLALAALLVIVWSAAGRCAEIAVGAGPTFTAAREDSHVVIDGRIRARSGRLSPYVSAIVNPGNTSVISGGLEWRHAAGRFYLDPLLGVGVSSGPERRYGSHLLFHIGVFGGFRLTDRTSVEIGVQHWSNGYFAKPNPGINVASIRLSHRF